MAPTDKNTAPETAVIEAPKPERKGKQLSATVTPEFYSEFSDLQWDLRKPVPELIRQAAEEFLAKNRKSEAADAKA